MTAASTTLSAFPRQRYSFGVVSAYIAGATSKDDRVKVDGGKVTADPIGRALNAVVFNVHPRFNPKAPGMEAGERWRAFIGAAITPNLGIAVGGGYGFLQGLSVNGGYAMLIIPTMRHAQRPPGKWHAPVSRWCGARRLRRFLVLVRKVKRCRDRFLFRAQPGR